MADAVRCVICWLMNEPDQDGFDDAGGPVYQAVFKPVVLRNDQDGSDLRDFVAFQTFNLLQGAELDRGLIKNTLRKYLEVVSLDHYDPRIDHDDDWLSRADWITDALAVFLEQTEKNKQALHDMGLVDAEFLYWWHENKTESLQIASFYDAHRFTECNGINDYPDGYYQVEDDYIPSRSLVWIDSQSLPF
ncbi:hypothetical protein D9M68_677010 [compost metagenome]